jgi:hypothetical protein
MAKRSRRSRRGIAYRINPAKIQEARARPPSEEAAAWLRMLDALTDAWLSDAVLPPGSSVEHAREAIYYLAQQGFFEIEVQEQGDGMALRVTPTELADLSPDEVAARILAAMH